MRMKRREVLTRLTTVAGGTLLPVSAWSALARQRAVLPLEPGVETSVLPSCLLSRVIRSTTLQSTLKHSCG
jgi:hypothetical protein